MPREVQKKFERATRNMSVPVMVALLSRIYNRLQEDDKLDDAAAHIREAQKLPRAEHGRLFLNETVDRIDYAASADRGGQIPAIRHPSAGSKLAIDGGGRLQLWCFNCC